jgi:hypothetical protein
VSRLLLVIDEGTGLADRWRLRGLFDAWRGKTGWEKFARVGFREGVAPAHG